MKPLPSSRHRTAARAFATLLAASVLALGSIPVLADGGKNGRGPRGNGGRGGFRTVSAPSHRGHDSGHRAFARHVSHDRRSHREFTRFRHGDGDHRTHVRFRHRDGHHDGRFVRYRPHRDHAPAYWSYRPAFVRRHHFHGPYYGFGPVFSAGFVLASYPPRHYYYYDPYCDLRFSSLVVYETHLHAHDHPWLIRVIAVGGYPSYSFQFSSGHWVFCD